MGILEEVTEASIEGTLVVVEEEEAEERYLTTEATNKTRNMTNIENRIEIMNLLVWVEEAIPEEKIDSIKSTKSTRNIKDIIMTKIEEEGMTQEAEDMKMIETMVEIMKVTEVEVVEIEIEGVR